MGFVVLSFRRVLAIPVRYGEYARMKSRTDKDVMIINHDLVTLIVGVLVAGFPFVGAFRAPNATKGDVR